MSDPRLNDPRLNDPRLNPRTDDPLGNDPVPPRRESAGGLWGWIAGFAVLALIAFVLIAGWNSGTNTAGMAPPNAVPATSNTAAAPPVRNVTPPSTTGSGTLSPQPSTPVAPTGR